MSDHLRPLNTDPEPDIVLEVLQRVRAVVSAQHFTADLARQIEVDVRAQYGGLRVRIPKRKKHLTPTERQDVYRQGLGDAATHDITGQAGIHRATLYRLMKRGSGA